MSDETAQLPTKKNKFLGLKIFCGIFTVLCAVGLAQGKTPPLVTQEVVKEKVSPTSIPEVIEEVEPTQIPENTEEVLGVSTQMEEPTAVPSSTIVPTLKPTARPTSKPRPTVKPTVEVQPTSPPQEVKTFVPTDSGGDKDCPDFATHAEAQAYFESKGGSPTNNVDRLDADHDGIACENNP